MYWKDENKEKEAGRGPFKKHTTFGQLLWLQPFWKRCPWSLKSSYTYWHLIDRTLISHFGKNVMNFGPIWIVVSSQSRKNLIAIWSHWPSYWLENCLLYDCSVDIFNNGAFLSMSTEGSSSNPHRVCLLKHFYISCIESKWW